MIKKLKTEKMLDEAGLMKQNWMTKLAEHYEETKRRYPRDQLIILFDIDDTILDMRYLVWNRLHTYDQRHQTNFFYDLTVSDITVHENDIRPLLNQRRIRPQAQQKILA